MADTGNPTVHIKTTLDVAVVIYDQFKNQNGMPVDTPLGAVQPGDTAAIPTLHAMSKLLATAAVQIAGASFSRFPVKVMVADDEDTEFAITDDDRTGMEQALQFVKYCTAFPSSDMARRFLSSLQNDSNLKQQRDAVNEFFTNAPAFPHCTWDNWHAIIKWQSESCEPWQGPYYLYSNPAQVGASSADTAVKLVAVVNIAVDGTGEHATINLATADGKIAQQAPAYTLVMDAASGKLREQDPSDELSVDLTPTWLHVPQSTGDNQLASRIGSALTGTVNNTQVTGTQQMRELPASQAERLQQDQRDRAAGDRQEQFDRIFSKITELVGLLVGIGSLYVMYKQWKEGSERAAASPDTDGSAREGMDELRTRISTQGEQVANDLDRVTNLNRELADTRAAQIRKESISNNLSEQMDAIHEQVRDAAELGAPDPALEAIYENLEALGNQQDASPEALQQDLAELNEQVNDYMAHVGADADADLMKTLQQTQQASEQLAEQQQQLEQTVEESADPLSERADEDATALEPAEVDPVDDFPIIDPVVE